MAITQTDIENVFGVNNVAQWSTFLGGTQATANTGRVSVAIAWATAYVESKLRNGPYQVPIANADYSSNEVPEILDCKATIAGWWLWKTRGLNQAKETMAEMDGHKKRIDKLLLEIRTGSMPIAAIFNTSRTTSPFVARPQ